MADLAERVQLIDAADTVGIRVAAVLLLLVFAVKAAVVPLHFWLPSSYAEAPAPVAALFAIMTKVGAYAIIRVYTLIFPPDLAVTAGLHGLWLMPAALVSLAIGMMGVLAARQLDRLVAFSVIGSMGMVMVSIALFTPEGIAAALYYIVHSTLAAGALFLIADLVRGGRANLDLTAQPPVAGAPLTAAMFFAAAIAMAGLPPLSGFVGKLLILDAAIETPLVVWIWAVVLGSSLISLVGFARAGSVVFWKAQRSPCQKRPTSGRAQRAVLCRGRGLLALLVAHTVLAGPRHALRPRAQPISFSRPEAPILVRCWKPPENCSDGSKEDIDMMRAFYWLLPHPFLTLLLTVVWILLQHQIARAWLSFGLILGIVIPMVTAPGGPTDRAASRPCACSPICLMVLWDIIVANIQVAWIVLTKSNARCARLGCDPAGPAHSPRRSPFSPAPSR